MLKKKKPHVYKILLKHLKKSLIKNYRVLDLIFYDEIIQNIYTVYQNKGILK